MSRTPSATRRSPARVGPIRKEKPGSGERGGPRREILASEVLDKAAALFAERGYAATSLQDIADRVGISRTAIYYYFDSKEAVLHELVRGVTREATRIFDDLDADRELSPAGKVHAAARRLVLWVLDPHTHFKLVDRSEHELPSAIAAVHRQSKRRVLSGLGAYIDAGIVAGDFRAVDPRVAAFAIIGMCNWTAWWFNPRGERSAMEIAQSIADMAVASLRHAGTEPAATDIRSLTAAIRAELDVIDRVHGKSVSRSPR